MKRNVYFLKDSEINDWLIQGFSERKYDIYMLGINNSSQGLTKSRLGRIFRLHFQYFKLALTCLNNSKEKDIVICYLDVIGLYFFLFTKIARKKRDILIINLMFNENGDLITKIKQYLFMLMLRSKNVYVTITSSYLNCIYKKQFCLKEKEFLLLHDCYGKLDKYRKAYKEGDNYVFCGGTNGRDWETLIKAARLLPQIKFVIVGPSKFILGNNIPSNIDYYFNIPYEKFQQLLENCSILAMPLRTEAPAGLILLFSAGLMSKAVITTSNMTMNEYIISGIHGILVKKMDCKELANQIFLLMSDKEKQRELGEALHIQIENVGSPKRFVNDIINIIDRNILNENIAN